MRLPFTRIFLAASVFVPAALTLSQEPDPYAKQIAKASDEAKKAIARLQLEPGLKVSLFAAEPLLANPVAFSFDEKGRCFVAETFRLHKGVTDNRNHPREWTDDDLAARTVADRLALYKKHLGNKFAEYGVDQDRIRLIEDTDGDGVADKATVFAGGFNQPEDGLGSGVLARDGKVWYTNIPHLWLLEDSKRLGKAADIKKSLHTGYGVHVSFIGHDSHGLRMGPDGRLYFSIGDRGFHIELEGGKTLSVPDAGAVLRCDPNGTNLEVVHIGLRNPQELAFDEYGNLFTGDNNADGGDQARWVQIVEGGDSGWRIGYQYMPGLGPWNREKVWHTQHDAQPAQIVPPITHIASGPSGLTYNPGVTLLPARYAKHFFLCDFRGGPNGSSIHAFTVEPKGATFELTNRSKIVQSNLPTDCDFGPDGGLYWSDWVDGWGLPNKGRIYKIFDPAKVKDPAVREVKQMLAEGMGKRPTGNLTKLLEHGDMRIRQAAQFELVRRHERDTLLRVVKESKHLLARLHGMWGLGQLSRAGGEVVLPMFCLTDPDAEMRAQALKIMAESMEKAKSEVNEVRAALKDASPRVRYFAALCLARSKRPDLLPALLDMLRENAEKDAYLRHAGVMALAGIGDKATLQKAAGDVSPSVRLAALLAMRRRHLPAVAQFLSDVEPRLQAEAARAIYDEPIPEAIPQLAALLPKAASLSKTLPPGFGEPLALRVLAAQRALGAKENAVALAAFAAQNQAPENLRLEALKYLSEWEKPGGRDPIVGLWRPHKERPGMEVAAALRGVLPAIMTSGEKVRTEGVRLAGKHGIKEVAPFLRELVKDNSKPAGTRVEALKALASLADAESFALAQQSLKDKEPRVRHAARTVLLLKARPEETAKQLAEVLDKGTTFEQQGALKLLGELKAAPADAVLAAWLDRLQAGKAPAELHLDLLESAQARGTPELKSKLAAYESSFPKNDQVLAYKAALAGGDAETGRNLFFNKTELSCIRCHKAQGTGGEVGPDLTGIGKRFPRPYLLEALVDPNRQIAKGFETVVLTLQNGQQRSGILKSEDAKEVRLMTAEGQIITVPKGDIDERTRGKSAMPEDLIQKMSRRELRDLVEFLAGL